MPSKTLPQKKTNRGTICLSDPLHTIARELMRRERYRSHSECYESFLRHWAMSQQEHSLTGSYPTLSPEELAELDEGLLQLVQTGKGKKGSWLKKLIYDTIKEINGADATTPTVDQVLLRLPEAARKNLSPKKP